MIHLWQTDEVQGRRRGRGEGEGLLRDGTGNEMSGIGQQKYIREKIKGKKNPNPLRLLHYLPSERGRKTLPSQLISQLTRVKEAAKV